jgi:flavin-dependent dehydrogenase
MRHPVQNARMMPRLRTISIAGAGPAGLTAAINLARAGSQVIVHEQHADVGMRFGEDFQALENWTSEEDVLTTIQSMGVSPDFYCRPIHKVSSYGPWSSTQVRFGEPLAYLIRRGQAHDSLDASLKRQALACGVQVRFNSRLPKGEADIVATGPCRARTIAAGIVFETDLKDHAAVLLDDAAAPKGYAYVLAADGRGTLATVLYERHNQAKACLDVAIRRFKLLLDLDIRAPKYFGGYGNFALVRSAVAGHRRYVGEAAGFQDYLFGFGIRYALLSGCLAARSIIEGTDYDSLWRRSFGAHLRTSLLNRYWYRLFGPIGYDLLVRASGWARDSKRFWTNVYTRPLFRTVAYPMALQSLRLSQIDGNLGNV